LTIRDRETITRGLASGDSIRAIARQLERSPSTVCREVNNNGGITH
jgi:IS30 family transposase